MYAAIAVAVVLASVQPESEPSKTLAVSALPAVRVELTNPEPATESPTPETPTQPTNPNHRTTVDCIPGYVPSRMLEKQPNGKYAITPVCARYPGVQYHRP
ncbi:MAG: hypothetical protein ACAF41_12420 [Leptolyngbya sp. BL-A-14]